MALIVLGSLALHRMRPSKPADFGPAEETLRAAGLPTSIEEFTAQIEPVPPEANAAAPFLEAGRALAGDDPLLAAFRNLDEHPSPAEFRAAKVDQSLDVRDELEAATTRQAAASAAELEAMKNDPMLRKVADQLAELAREFGDGNADPDEFEPNLRIAFIRQVLREQQPPIDAILSAERSTWPVAADWEAGWRDPPGLLIELELDYLGEQRALSRLLRLAAVSAAADGNFNRAMDLTHAMWSQAQAMAAGSFTTSGSLLTIGLEAHTLTAIQTVLRDMPDAALQDPALRDSMTRLASRLEDERPLRHTLRAAFIGEAASAMQICRQLDGVQDDVREKAGLPKHRALNLGADALLLAQVHADAMQSIDVDNEVVAIDRLMWTQRHEDRAVDEGLLVTILTLPAIDRVFVAKHRIAAGRRAMRVAFACRLYAADHAGKLPPTLDALVPDYLDAIPTDPTDKDALPIRYDAGRALVWTSGWDNDDDDGISLEVLEAAEPDASSWQLRGRFDEVISLR